MTDLRDRLQLALGAAYTLDRELGGARCSRSSVSFSRRSTRDLERDAERNCLARYADQDFCFADAVSFAVMTERRIREALSLDHHFVVAGFQAVGVR